MKYILLAVASLMAVFAASACISAIDSLALAANGLKAIRDANLVMLEDRLAAEGDRILADESLSDAEKLAAWDDVKERYAPAFEAHRTFRLVWQRLQAAVELARVTDPDGDHVAVDGYIAELRRLIEQMRLHELAD